MTEIIIDPEFAAMMPEGSETENQLLAAELINAGKPEFPLIVWKGTGLLVDGHRRWKVIQKHSLKYEVVEQEFSSRAEVYRWILVHQLARRSISDHARAVYTRQLYDLTAARRKYGDGETAEIVAEMTGQSKRSVFRKLKYTQAVDAMHAGWQAEAKRGRLSAGVVGRIAKLPMEEQQELLTEIHSRDGGPSKQNKYLAKLLPARKSGPGHKMRQTDTSDVEDLPMIDVDPKTRSNPVGNRTIVKEIDEASEALEALKARCQKLINVKTLDSPELRNRIFGAIQTIHANLQWVRERKADASA